MMNSSAHGYQAKRRRRHLLSSAQMEFGNTPTFISSNSKFPATYTRASRLLATQLPLMQSSSQSGHGDDRRDQSDRLRVKSVQHRQHRPSLRRAEPHLSFGARRQAVPRRAFLWNITFISMICNYNCIGYP